MAEPGAKLRPGVRLFPGGHVILLPTQIMAIIELAEMAHCRHQCSARIPSLEAFRPDLTSVVRVNTLTK
ncbi:hypothetical protein PAMP_015665 [Pampus punctatissimus]